MEEPVRKYSYFGKDITKPNTKKKLQVGIRVLVSKDLAERIMQRATLKNRSVSSWIRIVIERYFERLDAPPTS